MTIPTKDEFVAAGYKAENYDAFVKEREGAAAEQGKPAGHPGPGYSYSGGPAAPVNEPPKAAVDTKAAEA
jgi:hypothetical protein